VFIWVENILFLKRQSQSNSAFNLLILKYAQFSNFIATINTEQSLCCRQHANHHGGLQDKLLPISLAYQFPFHVLPHLFGEGVQLSG
jgi:hypothetical protein